MNTKPQFLHERLLAYSVTRDYYRAARTIAKQLPRGLADLGDQLTRAARTSCLAIAEGANARSVRIKRQFFERATASNGESAACLEPPSCARQGGKRSLRRASFIEVGAAPRRGLGRSRRGPSFNIGPGGAPARCAHRAAGGIIGDSLPL